MPREIGPPPAFVRSLVNFVTFVLQSAQMIGSPTYGALGPRPPAICSPRHPSRKLHPIGFNPFRTMPRPSWSSTIAPMAENHRDWITRDETTAAVPEQEGGHRWRNELIIQPKPSGKPSVRDREWQLPRLHQTPCGGVRATWGIAVGACSSGPLLRAPSSAWWSAPAWASAAGQDGEERHRQGVSRTVRAMMKPGTSALFLVVREGDPGQAVGRAPPVRRNGAEVIPVRAMAERQLQDALHGDAATRRTEAGTPDPHDRVAPARAAGSSRSPGREAALGFV